MKKFLSIAATAACLLASSALQLKAADAAYAPGQVYGKADQIGYIASLAVGKDDFLVVAAGDKVYIFDPAKEQSVRNFATGLQNITAVAYEEQKIYVFSRRTELKEMVNNGRKFTREVPIEALCKIFTWEGAPVGDLKLENLADVINAKVVAGKIYAADFGGTHLVRSFDAGTGKSLKSYGKDLRLCCGILDFAVDPQTNDVLIANLGAFRLERYSATGNLKNFFGKRSQELQDFQGCCNPVAASVLPGGNLVVAEKDPSRVKVYTPHGAMVCSFSELQNLVKGCNRVSVASDSKGRVYLGANTNEHIVLQYVPNAGATQGSSSSWGTSSWQ